VPPPAERGNHPAAESLTSQPAVSADDATGRGEPRASGTAAGERRDWAFIGLMTFTAVLFFRPQDTIPALDGLHLAELSAIGALIAMMAGRLSRGQSILRFTPELAGVIALGAAILVLAPFSIWMGGAIGTFTDLYVKVILIFIVMVNTLKSPKRVDQFVWLIVVATAYLAFRAVFDYARGLNLIENGRVQGAVGGMFGNPNDLALNMVVVIPLAVSVALRAASIFRRLAGAVCALLMLGAVVASQSRGGTVGLAVMLLLLGVSIARRKPLVAVGAVLLLMLAVPLAPASYWQRVASITDESQDATGSRATRRTLLTESYKAFLEHPLTGVGAGQFKNYDPQGRDQAWHETHNVVLQVAAELGVVGLAIFMFLVGRGAMAGTQARRLLRTAGALPSRKRRVHAPAHHAAVTPEEADWVVAHGSAMVAALVGWFVCALFASVAYQWTFYYLLALAIAPREFLVERLAGARRARPVSVPAGVPIQEARA
jgi:O-antigen ligase